MPTKEGKPFLGRLSYSTGTKIGCCVLKFRIAPVMSRSANSTKTATHIGRSYETTVSVIV